MKLVWCLFALILGLAEGASAQLRAGDIAVIAFNSDAPDAFAWVTLVDIPANTPIHFTNSSVSNGWFRWGDHLGRNVAPGPLTWVYSNNLAAGTVVSWISGTQKCWSLGILSGGAPTLSTEGDQIIVFTGAIVSNSAGLSPWIGDCSQASLLFGLNFANTGWNNINGGEPSTSYVPPGLSTNLGTAVHVGSRDNGYYAGPVIGTSGQLRKAVGQPDNWIVSDSILSTDSWPVRFSVNSDATMISVR